MFGVSRQLKRLGMVESEENFQYLRDKMVKEQIERQGISDSKVLNTMKKIPRHLMVPGVNPNEAYEDHPQPIGYSQTISQPFIVAYMTCLLKVEPHHKVLEVGTGSGYQTVILAELSKKVYTIEIIKPLYEKAVSIFDSLGYTNICSRFGDGYEGWSEHSPYHRILIAAAPSKVPTKLLDQLALGGRMILPLGDYEQSLVLVNKDLDGKVSISELIPVRFVPMTGKIQFS